MSDNHKLVSIDRNGGLPSEMSVDGVSVGEGHFTVIAGPCAVESREQALTCAAGAKAAGATMFRGGAYKPRTSPYSFQGLGRSGLALLAEAKASTGLPIVTELLDVRDLETLTEVADVIQIGARNMYNTPLLREVGRSSTPVMLKRGLSATIDEFLHAAEYVLHAGNERVILCERGIRTFESAYRFTLDVAAVPVLKSRTHLPVIVDPSHAAGMAELVEPLALAATAVGADGLMIEAHHAPEEARCDADQAVPVAHLGSLIARVHEIARLRGKRVPATNGYGTVTGSSTRLQSVEIDLSHHPRPTQVGDQVTRAAACGDR
jgi:3-deoxy-7-phosphoheptulonate synthase